jgi:polyvinyl alcohol dehydrogenase (cytochrome)
MWDFDTTSAYKTLNGVEGRGGSIDGPRPEIGEGMLFADSGYALPAAWPATR